MNPDQFRQPDGFYALPAPAKLNLFLHIIGRRDDGYHLLQSTFQLIDRCDTIELRVRDDGQLVHLNPIPGIAPESDLCIRAARLLQEQTGCRLGMSLRIRKILPMGGGVGGGSSDAATVLLALNRLWNLNLSRQMLMDWGVRLGADVPFFLFGRTAFVEGIGERMTEVPSLDQWFVVLHPRVHVPTPEIFCDERLTRNTPPLIVRVLNSAATKNDLQAVASRKFPLIQKHLDWLGQFGEARMTGSGSCVFAKFASQDAANQVISQLPDEMTGFIARSLSQHQLYEFAD
ncbi:4-(cytidine 5'-diphospho)-2-C-methyl-D-erythritol kinase [Chitinilyticum piscinae]|uniref:4-diphosphocytidyl-2-C-methyl-D-erythritol kinase n=1 Tax=Chitinilyticum piscinae TaxID=2866724 RepID=A0A8J7FMI6_9NEIS|nr:4-(cytidine 5'-diphospho)-2-C-methyl-D-erythritol kinase [Chitinilyticum piscinae]MBE9609226.1 4-(cytidine 5'-diphospho)-2-C-methyl-D-erythritol kinase [Chitinilyticum piscinae]